MSTLPTVTRPGGTDATAAPAAPSGGDGVPAGYRRNKQGKLVKVKGGGGGGAGAGKPAGFQGQSPETAAAVGNAMRVAGEMEDSDLTRAAQGYATSTLGGGADPNAYRAETADMLRNMDDSDYRRYLDALFESDTGLGGGGGTTARAGTGGGGMGGRFVSQRGNVASNAGSAAATAMITGQAGGAGGGGAGNFTSGPTEADLAIKRILAGEDAPGAQAMRDRIKRQADESYNEALRQRRLEASGSNMYGGSGQMADEAWATSRYGTGLADAYAQQDYELYRQALGLGAGYDTATLDRAAQERMNAANNATASAGIGASSAAAAADIASRERLYRLGALGEAIGMGNQRQQFGISGMGSLAEGMSADQRAALGLAGDTNAMGQAGWLNAGGLSLGSDQARNAWQNSQNALRGQLAGVGLGRQQLAFDQYRYNREAPMRDIAQYQAIISGTYDPYASTRDVGLDRRNQSPSYTNVGSQALSGAIGGYYLGRDIGRTYGTQGGG